MSRAETFAAPGQNRLLSALPPAEQARLRPHLECVEREWKETFYDADGPIPYVYFPTSLVGSLIVEMDDGRAAEFATVGNEGLVGVPVFLRAVTQPSRAICQVRGGALRMEAETFREHSRSGPLHDLLLRYTQALLNQAAQSAACNRLHSFEERCARWLLMTHDRVGRDEFELKQEFLAMMLGTRRPTVSVAAGILQKAGFIRYRRGQITIVDREGLESASCECYSRIHREFERLLSPGRDEDAASGGGRDVRRAVQRPGRTGQTGRVRHRSGTWSGTMEPGGAGLGAGAGGLLPRSGR